jgi:hypothetical protein
LIRAIILRDAVHAFQEFCAAPDPWVDENKSHIIENIDAIRTFIAELGLPAHRAGDGSAGKVYRHESHLLQTCLPPRTSARPRLGDEITLSNLQPAYFQQVTLKHRKSPILPKPR